MNNNETTDPSVRVIFRYDNESGKWEIFIRNTSDVTEAQQAFNAVVLTCRDVVVGLNHKTKPFNDNTLEIIPEVTIEGLMRSRVNQ